MVGYRRRLAVPKSRSERVFDTRFLRHLASQCALVGVVATCIAPNSTLGQTRPVQDAQPTAALQQEVPQRAGSQTAGSDASGSVTLPAVQSNTEVGAATAGRPVVETIQARLQQLQGSPDAASEANAALMKLYQQALSDFEAAATAKEKRIAWQEKAAAAPKLLENAKQAKASLQAETEKGTEKKVDDLTSQSFEQLQQNLSRLQAELSAAAAKRLQLQEEVTRREQRRKELPQQISAAKTKLQQAQGLASGVAATGDSLVDEATQWSAEANLALLTEQLASLEAELAAYESETLLLPLQLELAETEEKRVQTQVRLYEQAAAARQQSRIADFASQLREQPVPQIAGASELYAELGGWLGPPSDQVDITWRQIAERRAALKSEKENAAAELARWREIRATMEARVSTNGGQPSVSGLNSWVGLMLREQRGRLPDPNQQSRELRKLQEDVQTADSLRWKLDDAIFKTQALRDVAEETQDEKSLSVADEILKEMMVDVNGYLNDLYEMALVRTDTREFTYAYEEFVDKHVLWIRSMEPLRLSDFDFGREAFSWFFSPSGWLGLLALLGRDAKSQPMLYLFFCSGMFLLVWRAGSLRKRLQELSAKAAKNTCTDYSYTTKSLAITVLLSLPISLLLLFLAWRIETATHSESLSAGDSEFFRAISKGLLTAITILIPMQLLRQLCRPDSLGTKHFGWLESNANLLRVNLRWLIDFAAPLVIVVGAFGAQANERWSATVGRVAFIALMPLLAVFFAFVFQPSRGLFAKFIREHQGGWFDRLRFFWYPCLVAGPIGLSLVSFVGYHYTAVRIATHLVSSLWMMVGLVVVYSLLKRWLLLNRRRIMLAQARQRLEEAAKRDPNLPAPTKIIETDEVNLVAINDQTKRLVTSAVVVAGLVGAYFIWSDVIPAVTMLDSFEVWTVKGSVPGEDTPITLANLVMVIPIVVLAVIAARNVPGLLEIAVLQHLPLTKAARYAITTLARYAIAAIGIVVVASFIGLQWSSIQWLVAALGVGLGFGLQEIFANFVSGIILLFEQPIRVGDVITIDGTTGTVSKIRMRATTILNWDRQELVIPNKDLITGKLLNWTLSDTTNRIVLNVGVAYGSDTGVACQIIRNVCADHVNVMNDPAPIVTFEGFGDNTLNLTLRAFLESLDHRLNTIHELHTEIYRAFNDAKIEIAFPQRDLHLRSVPESISKWLAGPNNNTSS